jgi:Leucine-rich repeat (LRR) protein
LEYLSLSRNKIETNNNGLGIFDVEVTNRKESCLRVLELDRCLELRYLPRRAFSHLPSLVKLSMESNGIKKIEAGAFEGLHNLRHLNLAYNYVKKFDINELFVENLNLMVVDLRRICLNKIILKKKNKKYFRDQACTVLVLPECTCCNSFFYSRSLEKKNTSAFSFLMVSTILKLKLIYLLTSTFGEVNFK